MRSGRVGVLFVCTGNICRSPTAEGVFRKFVADAGLSQEIIADSAGTHAYHVGEPVQIGWDPKAAIVVDAALTVSWWLVSVDVL